MKKMSNFGRMFRRMTTLRTQPSNSIEQQLAQSGQMLHALFEFNPQPIAVVGSDGHIKRVNTAAVQLSGYSYEEVLNQSFNKVVAENERRKVTVYHQQALKGVPQTFETAIMHREGYRIDLSVTAIPIRLASTAEVKEIIFIFLDITGNKRALERIRYIAYNDDMTGIPNRRFFREQLENALHLAARNSTSIAVFIIDIDRFKLFNDSFGHSVGDMLLMQVAERLTRCVSTHDVLARMEGDEFAIFYTDAGSEEEITTLAEQIAGAVEQPFECQGFNLTITMSIGIAWNQSLDTSADDLIQSADIALSRAKELRNNYQFYTSSMENGTLDRLTMESDLRAAIQRDEFELHYQPQLNIATGEIIGVEGLIRWNHPVKGMVMPRDFIGLAEENGMITAIGEKVIEMACSQAMEWQQQGLPAFPVAVNLSVRQFLQPNLTVRIGEILSKTGLTPHLLELEITESVASDAEFAEHVLQQLKQLGVEICIDDFGTGYSSLSFLRKFPISRIKIDRSFVRDIMSDRGDAQIVETIIAMSRHLKMKVIAEGVETEEQLQFLLGQQCYEAQGFLLARPMAAGDLVRWLQSR